MIMIQEVEVLAKVVIQMVGNDLNLQRDSLRRETKNRQTLPLH